MSALLRLPARKQFDLAPWSGQFLDGRNQPINCTGGTVLLYCKDSAGAVKFTGAVTMSNPTLGLWIYVPSPTDVDTVGTYRLEFHVHGGPLTHDTIPNDGYYEQVIQPSLGTV